MKTAYNVGMNESIGVSILTNGARLDSLQACVSSFLNNCHYRPLVIGIYDNGSTDGTAEWLDSLCPSYAIEWRFDGADSDRGCAAGTNASIALVRDCELSLHLESDFRCLTPEESGVDKMWLHRAVGLLGSGDCDFLYLRRMVDEREMMAHWWSQWMSQVVEERGEFLHVPGFWWSNNPSLFRTKALLGRGTLPLAEDRDGAKGTPGWSIPELEAASPPNTWISRWGMFVHERPEPIMSPGGCGLCDYGSTTCKYGFWKDGRDWWCQACFRDLSYRDMAEHQRRVKGR